MKSLPERFDQEGEVLRQARNTIRRFRVGDMVLVVKRYKVPLWFQRIDYTWFRPSKALRAYRYALRLKQLGINTPEAVACVEMTRWGLFRQGYFVSTECADPNLKCLLYDPAAPEKLFEAYVRFLVSMHEKGFLHGDLNLSNMLYHKQEDGTYLFTVIDTNRSHFAYCPTRSQCLNNLMRITRTRSFSHKVVARYAQLRGWDEEECVRFVDKAIDRFERKRDIKRKLKFEI